MTAKDDLEAMLGEPRFQRYFDEAGGDVYRAEALYRWNVQLAGALHYQLSHFEILTRNAMDRAIRGWNLKKQGQTDWALPGQSAALLYGMLRSPMHQAQQRAERESYKRGKRHPRTRVKCNHDDVVAQLTLGNWSNLLGEALPAHRASARILWEECLHNAFPNVEPTDKSRANIGKKFERLTHLRNRVSHQENLLEINVRSRMNDMLSVLRAIDSSYPAWALVGSRVREIVRQDPRRTSSPS